MGSTEQRTATNLDALALQGHLPPIDWHINNCVQIMYHLNALRAPQLDLFAWPVDGLKILYQSYLNSYDKRIRLEFLSSLRGVSLELASRINTVNWEEYSKLSAEPWELNRAAADITQRNYYTFEQYVKRCRDLICALHDFALGLGAVCITTAAEPAKEIYNELEKQT